MNAALAGDARSGRGPGAAPAVVDLDRARIERALARRRRYKYVRPMVEREGSGWRIVSPNCSRNVDPDGGPIDIAWLLPDAAGGWTLHARDHRRGCWVVAASKLRLAEALTLVCADPRREFWP